MAQPPSPPGQPGEPDPSMDDILASIRRILNEEDRAAAGPTQPADEILVLDPSMMVEEPPASAAAPTPDSEPEPEPMSEPEQKPAPPPEPASQPSSLVAPEAAAAAASSVSALMRTLAAERSSAVSRGGPTLEDLVREEIRPLLKEWLDAHLPSLVDRLVRAEIERVVGRAIS